MDINTEIRRYLQRRRDDRISRVGQEAARNYLHKRRHRNLMKAAAKIFFGLVCTYIGLMMLAATIMELVY